ncbi:MAG: hypothetical protein AMXMBFR13_22680 [Phycisphaerae bacterium]
MRGLASKAMPPLAQLVDFVPEWFWWLVFTCPAMPLACSVVGTAFKGRAYFNRVIPWVAVYYIVLTPLFLLSFGTRIEMMGCLTLMAGLGGGPIGLHLLFAFSGQPGVPPGCCSQCGYDLTGNVSGVCPECGQPVRG